MKNGTKSGCGIMLAFMLICVLVPTNTIATLSGNETLTFSSLSNVIVEATLYYSGSGGSGFDPTSEYLRGAIDYLGNGDGMVTASEVDDFEDYMEEMSAMEDCEYYMDGIRGEYTSINVSIKDATGIINYTSTITMDAETEITFSSVDTNLESHIFKEDGTKNVYVYDKTITVPEGYTIDTVTGIANTDIEIKFVRSNGSPGFELILMVCAIALFLFWRQKRRQYTDG
jgi:hypothetical protein